MPFYICGTGRADRPSTLSVKTGKQLTTNTHLAQDSDYESDGGSHYAPKSLLGQGSSARARRFESSEGKAVVVIDAVSQRCVDETEVLRKYRFFAEHYPEKARHCFQHAEENVDKNKPWCSYKLVVPFVAGVTYNSYIQSFGRIKDIEQQIHLFLSLVAELKVLHAKELVYIDFKGDNVLYDASTGQSHLIDGGASNKCGYTLARYFSLERDSFLERACKEYHHIAPECWTVKPSLPAAAHPSMDVFSLGHFLRRRLFECDLDADMRALTDSCERWNATARPTLDELSVALNALLSKRKYQGYVPFMQSIEGDKTDLLYGLLHRVAQHFLLDNVIRVHDRNNKEEQDIYSLQALAAPEQQLFLEIAGHVLFFYAGTGKLSELELPSCYQISMKADTLTIRVAADKTGKTVDIYDKRSWKINKMACERAFAALSQMHPQLEGFTYNIATPVASAVELWSVLAREQRRCYAFSCVIC